MQVENRKPVRFVECKLGETTIAPALAYLKRKLPGVEALQVVATPGIDRVRDLGIRVVSADAFLSELAV